VCWVSVPCGESSDSCTVHSPAHIFYAIYRGAAAIAHDNSGCVHCLASAVVGVQLCLDDKQTTPKHAVQIVRIVMHVFDSTPKESSEPRCVQWTGER
jgi:hypothetical protein